MLTPCFSFIYIYIILFIVLHHWKEFIICIIKGNKKMCIQSFYSTWHILVVVVVWTVGPTYAFVNIHRSKNNNITNNNKLKLGIILLFRNMDERFLFLLLFLLFPFQNTLLFSSLIDFDGDGLLKLKK